MPLIRQIGKTNETCELSFNYVVVRWDRWGDGSDESILVVTILESISIIVAHPWSTLLQFPVCLHLLDEPTVIHPVQTLPLSLLAMQECRPVLTDSQLHS